MENIKYPNYKIENYDKFIPIYSDFIKDIVLLNDNIYKRYARNNINKIFNNLYEIYPFIKNNINYIHTYHKNLYDYKKNMYLLYKIVIVCNISKCLNEKNFQKSNFFKNMINVLYNFEIIVSIYIEDYYHEILMKFNEDKNSIINNIKTKYKKNIIYEKTNYFFYFCYDFLVKYKNYFDFPYSQYSKQKKYLAILKHIRHRHFGSSFGNNFLDKYICSFLV